MKTILNALIIVAIAGLSSCISDEQGPQGPQGIQGPQGPQGPQGAKGDSGFVFEFEDVNFTAPDYEVFLPFPSNFESLTSDVALVYLLWDVVQIDGVDTEVWRQIPQTILLEAGLLQYNFDFTVADIRLFLDATFNLSLLGAIDTDDWVVRVVIVPGDFWNSSRIMSGELSYEDAKEMLGLPDMPVPAVKWQRR